jgi:hypothetical protein
MEGETVAGVAPTYGDRDVKLRELARKIDLPYKVIRQYSVSFVSSFLEQFGIQLGQTLNSRLVDRLVNGDQSDASQAAAVIGVNSVADGLVYEDLVTACVRMNALGYPVNKIVGPEAMIRKILKMTEFKDRVQGGPLVGIDPQDNPIPANLGMNAHAGVGASKICLVCTRAAMLQCTSMPMEVESDKIIAKRIEETVASITTDFVNLQRDARVIIDETVAFNETDGASGGFPTRMTAEG